MQYFLYVTANYDDGTECDFSFGPALRSEVLREMLSHLDAARVTSCVFTVAKREEARTIAKRAR